MSIYRYVLVDSNNQEGDYEYDSAEAAIFDAGSAHAVIAREYTFSDSELIHTPNNADAWPPNHASEEGD